jgi:hypothetical protein
MKNLQKLTKLFAFVLLLSIAVSACAQEGVYENRQTGDYNAFQEDNEMMNEPVTPQNDPTLQNEGAVQNEGAL